MKPALSAEEWAGITTRADHDVLKLAADGRLRAAAARALHGRPYGFTWEDVDSLAFSANPHHWKIADRLEGMLRPREG